MQTVMQFITHESDESFRDRIAEALPEGAWYSSEELGFTTGVDLDQMGATYKIQRVSYDNETSRHLRGRWDKTLPIIQAYLTRRLGPNPDYDRQILAWVNMVIERNSLQRILEMGQVTTSLLCVLIHSEIVRHANDQRPCAADPRCR